MMAKTTMESNDEEILFLEPSRLSLSFPLNASETLFILKKTHNHCDTYKYFLQKIHSFLEIGGFAIPQNESMYKKEGGKDYGLSFLKNIPT